MATRNLVFRVVSRLEYLNENNVTAFDIIFQATNRASISLNITNLNAAQAADLVIGALIDATFVTR